MVKVRSRVWIVWDMDAQTAVRIHTDNSPEMTHLSVWIRTDNNTNPGADARTHFCITVCTLSLRLRLRQDYTR